MDDKLRATLDKVVRLTQQDAEFGAELRKALGIEPSANSASNNISKDVSEIRAALQIKASNSCDYSFIRSQRLRDQLTIDNLRMENAAIGLQQNECLNGILGILGSRFLSKRGLALDCGARCLRESDIEGVMINEDTFFCPMQYGFQIYGIPLVAVSKDDEEFLFVADSGCDTTTISQKAIDGTTECKLTDEEDAVHSICGTAKVKMANVKFALCSQTIGENKTKCIEAEDEVKVLPFDYVDPGKDAEQKPPIFGLLSCKYMMRHKWVLDYKIGYIYSNAA